MTTVEQAIFFGAAVEDASEWQLTALAAFWLEHGPQFHSGEWTWRKIENGVRKIMGPEWHPRTQWGIAAGA